MANFITSLNVTLKHEGGYANLTGDSGGETIFGISRNNHPNATLWAEIDNYKRIMHFKTKPCQNDISRMNSLCLNNKVVMKQVQDIYYNSYWLVIKGDRIHSQELANNIFDMAVNSGNSRAIKLIQSLLGIKVDGIVGNQTISSINEYIDSKQLNNDYVIKRIEYYKSLNKSQFINGWINRTNYFLIK